MLPPSSSRTAAARSEPDRTSPYASIVLPVRLRVDLLQLVHHIVQHPVEALQDLHRQLLCHQWLCGTLLSLHLLLQLIQFIELLTDCFQQRVDVFFLELVKADLPRQLEALEAPLRKPLGQVEAPLINGELQTALSSCPTDAGLRHLLPGIVDMPNCITNGVGLPMTLYHVFLKFHLSLLGNLRDLLKLVQRHTTLQTRARHVF